jgi:hypothetical protein
VLPMGAPLPAAPPCILHRRFPRTAGDRHEFPLRVWAPQRGAWFICNSARCITSLCFFGAPTPRRDGTDDRLPTSVDVDMFNRNLLLTLAAVAIKRVEQNRVSAGEFVRLAQVFAPALERLFPEHSAPVTFHRCVVCGQQLSRDHSFELVSRPDTYKPGYGCAILPFASLLIRIPEPKGSDGLIGEAVVPFVRLRSADGFQVASLVRGVHRQR